MIHLRRVRRRRLLSVEDEVNTNDVDVGLHRLVQEEEIQTGAVSHRLRLSDKTNLWSNTLLISLNPSHIVRGVGSDESVTFKAYFITVWH